MMRFFAFVLSAQGLCQCTGFSPVTSAPQHHRAPSSSSALRSTDDDREVNVQRKVAGIAATLALGWAAGVSSSIAAPTTAALSDVGTSWGAASRSSSFVVAYSDSDFADFSLPSYQEVSAAEINTNLKGGKTLLKGDASTTTASSSSDAAPAAPAEVKKEPTKADLMAEKAAAKAAQKAARERQQAAVEAAAAAKQ